MMTAGGARGEATTKVEENIAPKKIPSAANRAFLENGVWAHKPAAVKDDGKAGRLFGGGWKRRYLTLLDPTGSNGGPSDAAVAVSYSEGPGKASKGTITFADMRTIELLGSAEAQAAKAPNEYTNFTFSLETDRIRYTFSCESADEVQLTVQALQDFLQCCPRQCSQCKKEIYGDFMSDTGTYLHPACLDAYHAATTEKCTQCGKMCIGEFVEITSGATGETAILHPECVEAWKKLTRPPCAACGEQILEEEVVQKEGSYYHKGCKILKKKQ